MGPELAVVIVAYDCDDVLDAALASIADRLPDAQVVIVDNGPGGGKLDGRTEYGQAVVLSGHGNVGFGAGVNLGVRASSAPHVLVMNPDAELERVDPVELARLAARPALGLIAASERSGDSVRPLLEPVRPWRQTLINGVTRNFAMPDELWLPKLRLGRTLRLSGAAFLLRRDEFAAVGGFNERLFLYYEDEELSARYRDAAMPVEATEAIVVAHEGMHSSEGGRERVIAWGYLSLVQMVCDQHGTEHGRVAARWVVGALAFVARLASLVARLPLLGGRARKKQHEIAEVQRLLADAATRPPSPVAYRDAAPLVREALGE